jgi:hypothetical protein
LRDAVRRRHRPPRLVVPQQLVQLHLEAHRQPVGDDPVGQFARRHCVALGENSTSQRSCRRAGDDSASPIVVFARADHELHLVARGQQRQVLPAVARRLRPNPAS